MAKVKITGHASGTGIITITAPNTSTDRTVTLPDATGTLLNSDGDGSSLTGISSVGGATGVDFNDNVTARFGTGNDLSIYHNGSHSYIDEGGTGNLNIQANDLKLGSIQGESYLTGARDGAVTLYYDNSTKLATSSAGVSITGDLAVSADIYAAVGSEGNPSFAFTGDTNTGLWHPDADTIAFSTAGNHRMRILADGTLCVGETSVMSSLGTSLFSRANKANGYSAIFLNDGNDANRWGILIACGMDTPSSTVNYPIKFRDGDGNDIDNISYDSTGISYNGQNTAKAWVSFASTTISDSHNVSSVASISTGYFQVNWTNDMGNANYAAGISFIQDASTVTSAQHSTQAYVECNHVSSMKYHSGYKEGSSHASLNFANNHIIVFGD